MPKEPGGTRQEELSPAERYISPEAKRERAERHREMDEAFESAERHLARFARRIKELRR